MHVNRVTIESLEGVSSIYKQRLIAADIPHVRRLIGWWGSEHLCEVLGNKHKQACFQLEHALKKLGYEFWFEPHLRKIEKVEVVTGT